VLAFATFSAAYVCAAPAATRVVIAPHFFTGASMVYDVETRTSTSGKVAGPIDNPESPTQATLTASFRVRLDVLTVAVGADGQTVRLRATWLVAHAQASSDAVNPAEPDPAAPFTQLAGRSLEFTLAPGGAMSQLHGLEDLPGGAPPPAAILWIASLISSSGFPKGGLLPNQQWGADQPLAGIPLAGLVWHAQSTYLRAEPCKPIGAALGAPCAAVLTHLAVVHRGSARGDATPPDYLRNGLRTSGTWDGSGEGLGSFSLADGLLVSGTQTSTQSYDYEIKSASSGTSIRYTGKVEGQTSIARVDQSQSPPQSTVPAPAK
jgi:hypothetical protein